MDFRHEVMSQVFAALASVASILACYALVWLKEALRKYVATTRYSQEIGILIDACKTVLARKAAEKKIRYIDMIRDFHLDQRELEEIKEDILDVANDSLKNLRGYIADEGGKRIASKLDFLLGELQSLVIGSRGRSTGDGPSTAEIGPDTPAN